MPGPSGLSFGQKDTAPAPTQQQAAAPTQAPAVATATATLTPTPAATPAPPVHAPAVTTSQADPMQTSALTPTEQTKAVAICDKLDVSDTPSVIAFGAPALSEIATFADTILDEAKSSDIDMVGEKVTDIVVKAKGMDLSGLNQKANWLSGLPFIGGLFDKVQAAKTQFDSLSTHIESVGSELMGAQSKLIDRITMLDKLYEKNVDQFRELNMYIAAGEMKIVDFNENVLPVMVAGVNGDPLKAQEVSDAKQAMLRFEKQVHNLKLTRISTLQSGPQIRIISANNQTLAEKIQSTVTLTIPLWKKQFLMALSLNEQKKAAELSTAVDDATNEMLRANADMLHDNSLAIAEQNERGVIDIETLEYVQNTLIATLEETLEVQKQGKLDRQAAATKMQELETGIQQCLLTD